MDIIRQAANSTCSQNLVDSISKIDSILLGHSNSTKQLLKAQFGLEGLSHDTDFASILEVNDSVFFFSFRLLLMVMGSDRPGRLAE